MLFVLGSIAKRLIYKLIPGQLQKDRDQERRAFLLLAFVFAVCLVLPFYGLTHFLMGDFAGVVAISVCVTLMLSIPFVLRATKSQELAGHIYCFLFWTLTTYFVVTQGGSDSPTILIKLMTCLAALVLLGAGASVAWGCVECLSIAVVFWLENTGHSFPQTIPAEWMLFDKASQLIGVIVSTAILFQLSEGARHEIEQTLLVANQQLDESRQEILSGIQYASTIQQAILPPREVLAENFRDVGLIYRPKDIVSGDFYWVHRLGETVFFALADCTGHGVPGGFMSLIGTTLLNAIVIERQVHDPGEILQALHHGIRDALQRRSDHVHLNDGMDIGLCALQGSRLLFAGARRPLWVFDRDAMQIREVSGSRAMLGSNRRGTPIFPTVDVSVKSTDLILLFSDGLSDFITEDQTRLGSGGVRRVLKESDGTVESFIRGIETILHPRGFTEQRDDITVLVVQT